MTERVATSCVCCGSVDLISSPSFLMPFISHRALGNAPVEILPEWDLERYGFKCGMVYTRCNSLFCKKCGHLFMDLRFSDGEMSNLYSNYRDEEYVTLRDYYEPGYKNKNNNLKKGYNYVSDIEEFIRPLLNTSKSFNILDWGGDTGKNTPFYDECGKLYIYDISRKISNGKANFLTSSDVEDYKYDLIVCSNVLEHVPYPLETLNKISKNMSDENILYIELPYENLIRKFEEEGNFSDIVYNKRHWHEHINFFTTKSIEELVKLAGLDLIRINKLKISGETSNYVFQVACKIRTKIRG